MQTRVPEPLRSSLLPGGGRGEPEAGVAEAEAKAEAWAETVRKLGEVGLWVFLSSTVILYNKYILR